MYLSDKNHIVKFESKGTSQFCSSWQKSYVEICNISNITSARQAMFPKSGKIHNVNDFRHVESTNKAVLIPFLPTATFGRRERMRPFYYCFQRAALHFLSYILYYHVAT